MLGRLPVFLSSTKQDKEPVERHNAVLPESPKTATRIFFLQFWEGALGPFRLGQLVW